MTIESEEERKRRTVSGGWALLLASITALAPSMLSCGGATPAAHACGDVLKIKSPPATLPCPLGKAAMCPYLESAGKDVQVHFTLSYEYNAPVNRDGSLDGSANRLYQQCILNYLAEVGLSGSVGPYDSNRGTVSVNGTYLQVVPVASRLDVVTYYDIDCSNGASCVDCMTLTVDQCADTPVCHVFWGVPVDVTGGCLRAARRLGCLPLQYEDSLRFKWQRDPLGDCWLIETTNPAPRTLEGWAEDSACGLSGRMPFPYCRDSVP